MIFEYDREADALYVRLRPIADGEVARTLELEEGVYVDLDSGSRTLGVEFIALAAFDDFLKKHGALNIPDHVEGRESFFLSPA
jgi:uncharacterized protein YuzE